MKILCKKMIDTYTTPKYNRTEEMLRKGFNLILDKRADPNKAKDNFLQGVDACMNPEAEFSSRLLRPLQSDGTATSATQSATQQVT